MEHLKAAPADGELFGDREASIDKGRSHHLYCF